MKSIAIILQILIRKRGKKKKGMGVNWMLSMKVTVNMNNHLEKKIKSLKRRKKMMTMMKMMSMMKMMNMMKKAMIFLILNLWISLKKHN
jgi:hypothetical protein